MSEKPKYLTVAFEINDQKEFSALQEQLRQLLLLEGNPPYRIVAMGLGNEFNRLELIEEAMELSDYYCKVGAISEILRLSHKNTYEEGLEVIKSWSDE